MMAGEMDGVNQRVRVGEIHAVMVYEEEIDGRDGIVGADQRDLLLLGQVAEIEEAEAAK